MRGDIGSTPLVRLLGEWTPADAPAPGADFAERLALWVNAFDALALQGTHQAVRALQATAARGRGVDARALGEDLQRVRGALASAIGAAPGDVDPEAGYAPWRRRHVELQQRMEQLIGPLREHLRQAVARASPRLRQLALLDAAFEQVLGAREQQLLPRAAGLLQQRHDQLRAAGRLEEFTQEWRRALLAEVDLRLEPAAGLVDALANESKHP